MNRRQMLAGLAAAMACPVARADWTYLSTGIDAIVVDGNQFFINMTDYSTLGPWPLPHETFNTDQLARMFLESCEEEDEWIEEDSSQEVERC